MMEWILETPDVLQELTGEAILLRLVLALLCGGVVGWERGRHGRAAGLRTHILVCLGACLAALSGVYTSEVLGFAGDPNRVAAQVLSGVGFLGAGTILIGRQVTGLTTAAGLWTTASVGIALGIGFYWPALFTMALVFLAITVLARIEQLGGQSKNNILRYAELRSVGDVRLFQEQLAGKKYSMDVVPARSGCAGHVGVEFSIYPGARSVAWLEELPYVVFIL